MASQAPPPIEAFLITDTGQKRPHNEDYVGHFVPDDLQSLTANGQLYCLADGVGGSAAGEVASEHAVKKVLHVYFRSEEADLDQRLVNAIREANSDLYEYAVSSNKPKMGTTLVAALVRGRDLHIANVGDSRAYLVRGSNIVQITQDHSLVDQLVREGSLTEEEARNHPRRSVLLRSLGNESKVSVDIFTGSLRSGDAVVLCSDGLIRHLDDEEIQGVVSTMGGEDACRTLVRMANERGGDDNISVVLLNFNPVSASEEGQPPAVVMGERPKAPEPTQPAGLERDAPPSLSAAQSLQEMAGKPKMLSEAAEPPSIRERLAGVPWRDVAYGAGALLAGVAVVVGIGFFLPSVGIGFGVGPKDEEAEIPATTVSTTATQAPTEPAALDTPDPQTEEVTGEATAIPVTPTPTAAPTLDPELDTAAEVAEGEFIYGATPLQSDEAQALCAELGGNCPAEFFEDAEPAVAVVLDAFFMDRTEVTNAEYKACVAQGGCTEPEGLEAETFGIAEYYQPEARANYPVVGVTWAQANTYCRWAGGRLPTEAEWEKAASWDEESGQKYVWPWGPDWDPALVNFREPGSADGEPEPVGSRPGNSSPVGALDMAGNVAEWVADWYAEDFFESLTNGFQNPQGPSGPGAEALRVVRGGSWRDNGVFARTVHRSLAQQDLFNTSIGLRCAYDSNPNPGPGPGAGAEEAPPLIPGEQTPAP